jgi:hypothetical protein
MHLSCRSWELYYHLTPIQSYGTPALQPMRRVESPTTGVRDGWTSDCTRRLRLRVPRRSIVGITMRPSVLVLSATALIAASSQPIRADPVVVDQVSALSASPANAASSSASTAQSPSMVVGISGQLVALEVFLSRWAVDNPSDARVASSTALAGDVSGTLASHTMSPFAIPPGIAHAPVHFDLASAQLQLIAGRLLAFVEGNPAAARVDLPTPAAQTGGPAFLPPAVSANPGLGPAVFAQPDPVPEPTTIALVGSGLLLGAMGRRRLRQRKESSEK